MTLADFRRDLHKAIDEIYVPAPWLEADVRKVSSSPAPRRYAWLGSVAATLLLVAFLGAGGWLLLLHAGHRASAPAATVPSAYQKLVSADWKPLASDWAAPVCRTPVINGGFANAKQEMPTDLADCRANIVSTHELATKMLADLDGSAVPSKLADQDAALRESLTALKDASGSAITELDQSQPPAFWDDINVMTANLNLARFAVKAIGKP